MKPEHERTMVCILAGGLSQRMGRDKSQLRLGRQTLVGKLRATLKDSGWPVRVLRRDSVDRCGPLGGIYTALCTTRAEAVIFLACDMPFVSVAWLKKLRRGLRKNDGAIFTLTGSRVGFPLLLRRDQLAVVKEQLAAGQFSLQDLSIQTHARRMNQPKSTKRGESMNINTPDDWRRALDWAESARFRRVHL
jgi:molybdenum cofactor guanylyltransferase